MGRRGKGTGAGETMKEKPQKHSLQALKAWPLLAVVETERKDGEGPESERGGRREFGCGTC